MATVVTLRAEQAAQILKVSSDSLLTSLANEGISADDAGQALLDAETTTIDDLTQMLMKEGHKMIPSKAAAAILKDVKKPSEPQPVERQFPTVVLDALKEMKPIQQWDDKSLLEKFADSRGVQEEQELDHRAKHQKFVVLVPGKYEPGKEKIDIQTSLELLKMARKRTTPSVIPMGAGSAFSVVYRVTELNTADRIIDLCPFCGEAMYQGYCEKCQVSFATVGDDERAYVRLITDAAPSVPLSFSDRKAIVASASKGVEDLKNTWPSISQRFDELKLTNSLPKLRSISNRPSMIADPYHVDGNRSFGNRSY